MKKFLSLLTVALMVFVVAVPEAEARRMGGGRNLGRTHRTAPAQRQAQPRQTETVRPNAAPQRRGMLGGLMGGLLAGGLIAALFGGAFNGVNAMDMVIVAALIWMAMRFLRSRATNPAMSGYQQRQSDEPAWQAEHTPNTSGGFTQTAVADDIPFNLPADFQMAAFLSGAREHYRTLQGAWNHDDFDTMAEYLSPALMADLKTERAQLETPPQTDVMYVDAEIVRADHDMSLAQISIKYTGRVRDRGDNSEEEIKDIWHLERDLLATNAPWMIVGIQGS
ncbi:Tim44 domain-containing protein [Thaumasiovibrio sp. DFM-14]|uniref:Tim44 domain-containing protein n=1 Tax=Thaumasiovibrio sp. DFM-14 TaxID=3384792 RepID=UPI0039A00C1E